MTTRSPSHEELIAAAPLLVQAAAAHGLSDLRLSDGTGDLVLTVGSDRTYFDVAAFEDEVEGTLGWRPTAISAGAPGAAPGRKLANRGRAA